MTTNADCHRSDAGSILSRPLVVYCDFDLVLSGRFIQADSPKQMCLSAACFGGTDLHSGWSRAYDN